MGYRVIGYRLIGRVSVNVLIHPVPGGVAIMSHWRQAAELGCKYALNFRSILWPIVNVTPGNAGYLN